MSLAERFFNLYKGLDRARGRNLVSLKVDDKGKRESKNQTVQQPYTVHHWENHLAGVEGLGVIPITDYGTCSWGAIDIDEYPLDLVALENKLKIKDLPMVVLRSKSGGAHITVFFNTPQMCSDVRTKLSELCVHLELGEREVYPKQVRLANANDVGNWLNMPYFKGNETERYAIINGEPATVEQFLNYAEAIRLDSISQIELQSDHMDIFDGPPCLQQIVANKAGQGERNNVLFNLGVYARLKWESNWEDQLEEFNRMYIEPPLNHREISAIVKSLEKKNYAYTCNNAPLAGYCNRSACKSRTFGVTAFQHVDVGIIVDSISKMMSEPPMWVLSLEGVRTEVETDELLDQIKFRRICVNAINKIPGRMKPHDWDNFIRTKLSEIETVEMPIEMRASDAVVDMIQSYFDSTPRTASYREMKLGKWMKDEKRGVFYFRGVDYIKYIERLDVKIDKRKMWSSLLTAGITMETYSPEKIEVWVVPGHMYVPENRLKFEKPEMDRREDF